MARRAAHIVSSERDPGGSTEDFTITDLAKRFTLPAKTVKLTAAQIPYTWFNIVSSNNQLLLVEPPNPGILITITPGNYTGPELAEALETAFNASGALGTYGVSFSKLRFEFTSTVNFSLDFNVANSLEERLGFPPGTVTAPAMLLVSELVAKLLSDTEIFICSDLVAGTDNGYTLFNPFPATNDQILAIVPLCGCYGSVINYVSNTDDPFFPILQSNYGKIPSPGDTLPSQTRFFLRFPSGFPLDLQDQDWHATLVFA